MPREKRVKTLLLNEEELVWWLAGRLWSRCELPQDVKVLGMYPDYARRAIGFIVHHPDFPEIEEGQYPPVVSPNEIKFTIHKEEHISGI